MARAIETAFGSLLGRPIGHRYAGAVSWNLNRLPPLIVTYRARPRRETAEKKVRLKHDDRN